MAEESLGQNPESKLSNGLKSLERIIGEKRARMASWFQHSGETYNGAARDIGSLSDRAGSRRGWNRSSETISLARRARGNQKFQERVQNVLSTIDGYYVHADSNAPVRCSDGRPSDRGVTEPLGPQVFAASVGAAIARHVVESDVAGETLGKDLRATLAEFREHGIFCGGHVDERGAHDPKHTGCAGIDRIKLIFEKLSESQSEKQLKSLTKEILGASYSESAFEDVVKQLQVLRKKESTYFSNGWRKDALNAVKEAAREREHKSVEKLLGKHKEVALVVNTVHGTTFENTRFSNDNKGEIQAFNYDVWEVSVIADRLYPGDDERRKKYLHSRVMLAVATSMVLTDGSLRVLVR